MMAASNDEFLREQLPQTFLVKYLGCRDAKGLWGIKHTRRPVDSMVEEAKERGRGITLMKVSVSIDGCRLEPHTSSSLTPLVFPIRSISYGVQDLVYTRVFAMIVVRDEVTTGPPFECHAFVCESRQAARRLTYSLAAAFQEYSKLVRGPAHIYKSNKFAIDLRTPEELADSEA